MCLEVVYLMGKIEMYLLKNQDHYLYQKIVLHHV